MRVYKFSYNPNILWKFLTPEQQIHIDKNQMLHTFEDLINNTLSASYPVENVTTFIADYNLLVDFDVIALNEECLDPIMLSDRIDDLWINLEWLRFDTVETHVKLMINDLRQAVVNHVIVMQVYLPKIYNVKYDYVNQLIEQYKDKKLWDKTRFVI